MEWEILKHLHRCHREGTLKMQPFSHHLIRLGEYETEVDYYFDEPVKVCCYLDGPPHLSNVIQRRDVQVSNALREKGYFVVREPYVKPSVWRRNEIVRSICQVVNARWKTYYRVDFQPRIKR
jgi:very-short-patch-repair endonuclease